MVNKLPPTPTPLPPCLLYYQSKHMHLKQESTILSKQHSLSSLIHSLQLLHFIKQKKILLWIDTVVSNSDSDFQNSVQSHEIKV